MSDKNSKVLRLSLLILALFSACGMLQEAQAHELYVLHPSNLVKKFEVNGKAMKGLIRSSLGNFGHYDSHGVFRGRVHYPIKNQDGCRKFQESDFDHNHLKQGSYDGHKMIVMVDRGHCHFVKKVQNIQKFGAVMAIIVDYHDEENTNMANDGHGSSIKIPSFLIGKTDGKTIKEAIHQMNEEQIRSEELEDWDSVDEEGEPAKNPHRSRDFVNRVRDKGRGQYRKRGHQVLIQGIIEGRMSKRDIVQVDLWYNNIYELYRSKWNFINLARMQDVFDDNEEVALGMRESIVRFQPRSLFLSGLRLPMLFKGLMCIDNGKYCGTLPIELQKVRNALPTTQERLAYSSRAVLYQSLREQCVFDAIHDQHKSHWFVYIKQLIDVCVVNYDTESELDTDIKVVTEECHDDVLNHSQWNVKIDKEQYKKCMEVQKSELEANSKQPYNYTRSKSFLDRDFTAKKGLGEHPMSPSITLNNISYQGDLKSPNDLFKKICSLMSKRPPQCRNMQIVNPKEEILREYQQEWGTEGSVERRVAIYRNIAEVVQKQESNRVMMQKKATIAEIILSLVILGILTCSILTYSKLYRKEQLDERMIEQINEQVSQYFQLAAEDPGDSANSSRTRVSDPDQN